MKLFFFKINPLQAFILSYLIIIVIGASLLKMPFSVNGSLLSWIDVLFTSTSALCVTGLIVTDTGTTFSLIGQIIIIVLIQIGGLGIMTFSTFILLVIGKRIGIAGSYLIQDSFSESGSLRIGRLIILVILFTVGCEIIGAFFLFIAFMQYPEVPVPAWSALFHSISAFCNAGFSLNTDSFCKFKTGLLVNITITTLIILGGIGFPVIHELVRIARAKAKRMHTRMNIHTKIVLITTLFFLISGTFLFYVTEPQCRENEKGILVAYFQSVTTRTAGFHTIDFSQASEATLLVTKGLMFIGGSSGSAAGGIKTTTFMVIMILVWSYICGKPRPEFSKRTISSRNTIKALSLLVLFLIIVFLSTVGILILHQDSSIPHKFSSALFEVISAIGTVGLSTGLTGFLNTGGKLIIIIVMFIGRLGPLAIAKLVIKDDSQGNYRFPEENLMIG